MRFQSRLLVAKPVHLEMDEITKAAEEIWDFVLANPKAWTCRFTRLSKTYPIVVEVRGQNTLADGMVEGDFDPPSRIEIRLNRWRYPLSERMKAELFDTLVHELTHYVQYQFVHGDPLALNPLGTGGMNENNHEAKALSSELCQEYREKLRANPSLTPNSFLNRHWKWKQIREQMDPKFRKFILKDLAYVKGEKQAFGPERSVRWPVAVGK